MDFGLSPLSRIDALCSIAERDTVRSLITNSCQLGLSIMLDEVSRRATWFILDGAFVVE
jgi:hypothetical protein